MMSVHDSDPEPSGRFEALVLSPDGSLQHVGARQRLQEAITDADAAPATCDVQVVALRPRRVVAQREVGGVWLKA